MSINLDIFFSVPFMMLFGPVFYFINGAGVCDWTITDMVVHMDVAFWKSPNNPTNYASVDDSITFLIMPNSKCTVPISGGINFIGVVEFGPRKKYPPAMLHASGSDM